MPVVTLDWTGPSQKALVDALNKLDSENRRESVDGALMEAGDYILGKIHGFHNSRRLRAHMRPKIWHGQYGRTSVNIATPTRAALGISEDDPNYWPSAYNFGHFVKGPKGVKFTKEGNRMKVKGAHFMERGFDLAEPVIIDKIDDLIWEKIAEVWENG